MTLRVATSDLGDSVPLGELVPSVVGSPYVMIFTFLQCAVPQDARSSIRVQDEGILFVARGQIVLKT